jgi:hypothetical protein
MAAIQTEARSVAASGWLCFERLHFKRNFLLFRTLRIDRNSALK